MYFYKVLIKFLVLFFGITICITAYAQSIPTVPPEIEFADVSIQLTATARQHLQQTLTTLYADRPALLRQLEMLEQLGPLIEPRLTDEHIPTDFRYVCLPFNDTDYDPHAYWGLSRQQATVLQLTINQAIDSRYHPILTTEVILPYFNQLQQRNRNWIKTLFQYFNPSADVATNQSGTARWLLNAQAPTAIWSILARKIAFESEQASLQLATDFVLMPYLEGSGKSLGDIAAQLQINPNRLTPYNDWLLAGRIPANGYLPVVLRLTLDEYPTVKSRVVLPIARTSLNRQSPVTDLGFPVLRRLSPKVSYSRRTAIFYQINDLRGIQAQSCDNAITLAYYGDLSLSTFLKVNDLTEQELVKPGEIYYLERKARRAKIPFHVVRSGQTLRDISGIYGVRLKSLLRFNRIKATQRVQAGRIVWMQRKRPSRFPVEYQPVEKNQYEPPTILANDSPPVTDSIVPQLQAYSSPPTLQADSTVTVDPSLTDSTSAQIDQVDTAWAEPPAVIKIHLVKAGQTYFSIAGLYGVTVAQLYAWNNLSARQPLRIGQELIIDTLVPSTSVPRRRPKAIVKAPPKKVVLPVAKPEPTANYYIVKAGETVYRIALNHGISVPNLMKWNGLKNFVIEVGQRLLIRPKE